MPWKFNYWNTYLKFKYYYLTENKELKRTVKTVKLWKKKIQNKTNDEI